MELEIYVFALHVRAAAVTYTFRAIQKENRMLF